VEINLWELWGHMGLTVRVVVIVLSLQAMACVAVVLDRMLLLKQSADRARDFAALAGPAMEAGHYSQVLAQIGEIKTNHLTQYLDLGMRLFLTRMNMGDSVERSVECARRGLLRKGDAISRDLNRGMNVLASTGSTAPFVGLLGTVLGIINAFKLIAATGSGGIGTIGSAIGESLVVTGYGLIVAIPSVLVFNWLSGKIASYEAGLLNAGSELLDRLEFEVRVPQQHPAAPAAPSSRPVPRPSPPVAAR
jgi:biopolymer transport protein ExbB/TolQ